MPLKGQSASTMDRLSAKYAIDFDTGCWRWHAGRSSQGSYPVIAAEGSKACLFAHRVAWESVNGPMPTDPPPDGSDRWELHHFCFNRSCVRPDHIVLVSRRQHTAIHAARRRA